MVEWGTTVMQRSRTGEREPDRGESTDDRSPDAEEIERIVDVAEWLGISPAVAAAGLRRGGEGVQTDVRLAESVRDVERQLRRRT